MKLRLQKISLPTPDFTIKLDLEIHQEVTAIFGPSGAGKTSILDLIAGLRTPTSAFIQLDDRVLTDTFHGVEVPTRLRHIGYVPQDLALFPHLSVRGNLLYGHQASGPTEPLFRCEHVTEVLEIQALDHRNVSELSGGEKQRVALARALLASPRLLLLDEPLGSLDWKLKSKIIPYLRRIRDEFRIPMLYVTHDLEEVRTLCDEVISIEQGYVVRRGSPAELFASA